MSGYDCGLADEQPADRGEMPTPDDPDDDVCRCLLYSRFATVAPARSPSQTRRAIARLVIGVDGE